jgi:hypothetical protein
MPTMAMGSFLAGDMVERRGFKGKEKRLDS